jgi:hypothetical protein
MKKFLKVLALLTFTSTSLSIPCPPNFTNIIAPAICQRLQNFGEKTFGMESLPPVKIGTGPFAYCSKKLVDEKMIAQIYTPPIFTSFLLSYGFRKGVMFHELTHACQPTAFDEESGYMAYSEPLNPHYQYTETEAEIEAMKHISCRKCAKEYGNGIIATHILFRIVTKESALKHGYAPFKMLKSVIKEKNKNHECDFHKKVNSNYLYRLSNATPYLTTLGAFFATQNNSKIRRGGTCSLGLISGLIGQFISKRLIAHKLETKVASGELNP